MKILLEQNSKKLKTFEKMCNTYFNLWFRFDAREAYLIWFDGEPDGVIVDADGKIPCFFNNEDLIGHALSLGLSLKAESPRLHNLDVVASWLSGKNEIIDCKEFLLAWNLFEDVSCSVNGSFDIDRKKTNKIYEKIFWGDETNILTPKGESYTPSWSKRELSIIRKVLGEGLSLFREKVICV